MVHLQNVETMGGLRVLKLTNESNEEVQSGLDGGLIDGVALNPYLGWAGNVSDLQDLSGPLRALVVPYGDEIDFNSSLLMAHPEIEYLVLSGFSGRIDLKSAYLKGLRIQVTPKMKFGSLPKLTELFLQPIKSTIIDLRGLCPALQSLEVSNGPVQDLTGIGSFEGLKKLELSYLRKLRKVHELASLNVLEELMVRATKKIDDLPEVLSKLKHLKVLKLWDAGKIENLEFLSHLDLRELRCVGLKIKNKRSLVLQRIPIVAIG